MESFLGISRFGIGGKHFPGISYSVVRRAPAAWLSLFSLQVDEDREEASGCGCLISSLGAIIDLNVYLGELCLFHCYLQVCNCYHGNLNQRQMSCWAVVLFAASLLGCLLGDIFSPGAGCAAAGICPQMFLLHPAFGVFHN